MIIAKLATRHFHEQCFAQPKEAIAKINDLIRENATPQNKAVFKELGEGSGNRLKPEKTLDYYAFQVQITVDVVQNGKVITPKIYTGVKFYYELEEEVKLPIKICDLAPLTSLAITIYNMDSFDEEPIASTVIDVFDQKRRLRQGTFNC